METLNPHFLALDSGTLLDNAFKMFNWYGKKVVGNNDKLALMYKFRKITIVL